MLGVRLAGLLFVAALAKPAASPQTAPVVDNDHDTRLLLGPGETQSVQVTASAGDFIRLISTPDAQLVVRTTLFDPAGKPIAIAPSLGGTGGTAVVAAVAEAAGIFRLDVKSAMFAPERRSCTVHLDARLPATPADRTDAAAHQAFASAAALAGQGTPAQLKAAVAALDEPLRLAREAGDRLMETRALFGKGQYLATAGDFRGALPWFEQALPLARQLSQPRAEAHLLSVMALVYTNLEEHARAIELYQQALAIEKAAGQSWESALTLDNLASSESALGHLDLALRDLRDEQSIRASIDDELGLNQNLVALADTELALGDNEEALESLVATLPHWPHLDDAEFEAATYNKLAQTWMRLGEYNSAAAALDKAGHLIDAHQMPRPAAEILIARAELETLTGDTAAALATSQKALDLARAADYRHGEVLALLGMGDLLNRTNHVADARERLEAALQIARDLGQLYDEASVRRELGAVLASLGEGPAARGQLDKALTIQRRIGDRFGEVLSLAALAKLDRKEGRAGEALDGLDRARALVESARSELLDPGLRAAWLASQRELYEMSASLLDERGKPAEALQISEQAHARVLLETIGENRAAQDVDTRVRLQEKVLDAAIRARAVNATSKQIANDPIFAGLLGERGQLDISMRQVAGRVSSPAARDSLTTAEIRHLLGNDTALLEYLTGPGQSHLWVLTRTALRHFDLPAEATLAGASQRLYAALTERNRPQPGEPLETIEAHSEAADREVATAAAALKRMVLPAPVLALAEKTLLVVPDGPLQYVPFSVLDESKRLVSAPSASVLAAVVGRSRPGISGRILILADPVYSADDPRVSGAPAPAASQPVYATLSPLLRSARDFGVRQFPRLHMSRVEADEIAHLAGPDQARALLDFDASVPALRRLQSGRYGIVHIAAHTLIDADRPDLSGVVLSLVDPHGRTENGFLRLADIYGLHLDAGLVTLSACQSSLGASVSGEGMLGLSRAFLSAGADRVLATLWSVEDRATAVFMQRFYSALLERHLAAPAALAAAQAEMRNDPRWRAPYYWAAFTLEGDWR